LLKYLRSREIANFEYELDVVKMPSMESVLEITTNHGVLTNYMSNLLEKTLNFRANFECDLETTKVEACANEAQIVLVFDDVAHDRIIVVVVDYGDVVIEN